MVVSELSAIGYIHIQHENICSYAPAIRSYSCCLSREFRIPSLFFQTCVPDGAGGPSTFEGVAGQVVPSGSGGSLIREQNPVYDNYISLPAPYIMTQQYILCIYYIYQQMSD